MERAIPVYNPTKTVDEPTLTPAACAHIKKVLARQPDKKGFRLSVKRSGCSGYSHVIDYVSVLNADDLHFFIDDLVILIDPHSLPYVKGICIDYVQHGFQGSLTFINPNQTATCGCGESFSVAKEQTED